MSTVQHLSHIGICVSDLERARRFYTRALGFAERGGLRAEGPEAVTLLGVGEAVLDALYLERDGVRVELLHFAAPGAVGEPGPRPMNRLGLTHLSLRVADLDAALAAVRAAGGRVLETSRVEIPATHSRVAFATDPDGTRLELLEAPGDPTALPLPP